MMLRLRHILLTLLLVGFAGSASAQETASSFMNRVVNKLQQSKSLTAKYTAVADGHAQSGLLTVCGDRFKLVSPSVSCWFDGTTQWTYSTAVGEINITTPTPEELQQVNPFAIIQAFRRSYTATVASQSDSDVTLDLKAKEAKSDLRSALLTVDERTLMPKKVEISLANGQQMSITISDIKPGPVMGVESFKFNGKQYPGIRVVDLR